MSIDADPLEKAIQTALRAHSGQIREGRGEVPDEPYVLHPLRVMLDVPREGRVVAVLHDVLEDEGRDALEGLQLREEEELALEALTRDDEEESYGEYISRLLASGSRLALLVKRADLRDNLSAACPPELRGRYQAALTLVEDALRNSDRRAARAELALDAAERDGEGPNDGQARKSVDGHPVVRLPAEDAEDLPSDLVEVEIHPWALYDSLQTAILLGFGGTEKSRRSQVSAIPDDELVRTPTGPRGGRIHFQGRDIIAYIQKRRERALRGRTS